ncbi:hypothetical protein L7F22_045830 [Adiantum nelumboides]|nr:hypothetical protein [Adiantum nelumboides]
MLYYQGQIAQDRPDLTARVFHAKHKDLMSLLIKREVFGRAVGFVSIIEFQSRGLPHAHILLILESPFKPVEIALYDRLVCAEYLDKRKFRELYDIVCYSNIHGPCGTLNPNAPCMVNKRCKNQYPKRFMPETLIDKGGYPLYMRRESNDPPSWRGPLPAYDVVHLIEDFEIVRHQYYRILTLMEVEEFSSGHQGCYHIRVDINKLLGRAHV